MARKARVKSTSGIYHVMFRGVNRQDIFHDDEDRMKFLEILKKYKEYAGLVVYAWCLMSNHIHLLLKEGEEGIGATMKRVGVSYALFFNWKYQTSGHLFQNRFNSESVEQDDYFLTVVRYIHQNPVKAGMVGRVEDWRWSSCSGYYDQPCFPEGLLERSRVLQMFSPDASIAKEKFREYNEQTNQDECLEDYPFKRRRLTDEEAGHEIKEILGTREIAQVKSLPKDERDIVLRKIKSIDGLSQRQAARILGIPPSLVFKV
ncbi:transposase [Mesobacillus boroniphilus]|uniref:Transposase n=1 Tax=Mesobacillus boroniphilus TaxID=308892 RepID=A0A944CN99_9BACI|nr:transposase [Mesobacillus boroniphilus]MBS8265685.1 transposase [Mesobacillus boroniphilus]